MPLLRLCTAAVVVRIASASFGDKQGVRIAIPDEQGTLGPPNLQQQDELTSNRCTSADMLTRILKPILAHQHQWKAAGVDMEVLAQSTAAALTRYYSIHKSIMLQRKPTSVASKVAERYVYMFMEFGKDPSDANIGNRMHQLVSSFMLAFITDRALIIENPDSQMLNHFDFFRDPCFDWNFTKYKDKMSAEESYLGNIWESTPDVLKAGTTKIFKGNAFLEGMATEDLNVKFPQKYLYS
jgi:hypothetical protein